MDVLSLLSKVNETSRAGARDVLPIGSLVLLLTALVAAGAPGAPPDVQRALVVADQLKPTGVALIALTIVAGSILLQPFIRSAGNLLKGGRRWGPLSWLWNRRVSAQGRKLDRLHDRLIGLYRRDPTASSARAREDVLAEIRQIPPASSLRPTALGNLITAVEDRAGRRYGFDTRVAIPRLDPLLRDSVRTSLNAARDDLNFAVRLTITSLLATAGSAALLYPHRWWLLVPAAALTSAWLCYRNSIAAAAKYGEELHVAFDLDRFKLYEESGMDRPGNPRDEHEMAGRLTTFWISGRLADADDPVGYR